MFWQGHPFLPDILPHARRAAASRRDAVRVNQGASPLACPVRSLAVARRLGCSSADRRVRPPGLRREKPSLVRLVRPHWVLRRHGWSSADRRELLPGLRRYTPGPEKDQSTLLSTVLASYFAEKTTFLRNTLVFLSPVMYLYIIVSGLRAVWSQSCVQCGSCSVLQARKQDAIMYVANKTCRCDSRTLWQHHVAMALPQSFLCVVCVFSSNQQQQQQQQQWRRRRHDDLSFFQLYIYIYIYIDPPRKTPPRGGPKDHRR